MSRRLVLLITSILVAAIGVALVGLYVRGADARATQGAGLVQVLAAKAVIQAGEMAKDGDFDTIGISRSTNAIYVGDPAAVRGLYATTTIYPGQPIVPQMFNKQGATTNAGIKPNQTIVQVSVGPAQRLAGYLKPGASVGMYVSDSDKCVVRTVLPHPVTVFGIGGNSVSGVVDGTGGSQSAGTNVTFELVPDDVPTVIAAAASGTITLALLGPGATLSNQTGSICDKNGNS